MSTQQTIIGTERAGSNGNEPEPPELGQVSFGPNGEILAIENEDGTVLTTDEEGANQETTDPNKPPATAAKPAVAAPATGTTTAKPALESTDGEPQFANHAAYVLAQAGYEGDTIKIGEQDRPIAELTPEEQLEVITTEYNAALDYIASQPAPGSVPPANAEHAEILKLLQGGMTPTDLAQAILGNNAVTQAIETAGGVDKVAFLAVKEKFPDLTDEEAAEQVEFFKKKGKLDPMVQAHARKLAGDAANPLTAASQAQQAVLETQRLADEKEEADEVAGIKTYFTKATELAGVPLQPAISQFIQSQILPPKPGERSVFIQQLNKPEKLARLAFLDTYHEDIVARVEKDALARGIAIGEGNLAKFSDRKISPPAGNNKPAPANKKNAQGKEEVDMDKMSEVTQIGTF